MPTLPALVVGDRPTDTFVLTLPNNAGQTLAGVTSANLKLFLHDRQQESAAIEGTGTFEIVDASAGIVTYTWSDDDTAKPGNYDLTIRAIFPGGAQQSFGRINKVMQPIVSA